MENETARTSIVTHDSTIIKKRRKIVKKNGSAKINQKKKIFRRQSKQSWRYFNPKKATLAEKELYDRVKLLEKRVRIAQNQNTRYGEMKFLKLNLFLPR